MRKSINKRYDTLIKIIIESGKIALQNFHPGEKSDYNIKSDSSELTKADLEVNEFLIRNLSKFYPQIPVISEENNIEQNAAAILCKEVFIIDPLDGTSSFVKGSPEFTINISLKSDKDLTLGAIYSPMQDILYYADNECGVYKISNASSDAKIQKLQKTDLENKSELNVIATRREDEFAEIKKMLFASDKKINYISRIRYQYTQSPCG
jgi:3'(2'), 5'-bisphosphate nucleotidase